MRRTILAAAILLVGFGISLVSAQTSRPAGTQPGVEAATRGASTQPVVMQAEVERLRREVAELKKQNEELRAENEKLKKQWNDAVRNGTGGASSETSSSNTNKVVAPAAVEQDGPGTYRVSAGPNGQFTTTVKAKSREDAISIGLKTVGKKAMDWDENVNLNEMKVERIGP